MPSMERLFWYIAFIQLIICTFYDRRCLELNGFLQRKPMLSYPCSKGTVTSSVLFYSESTHRNGTVAMMDDLEPPPINLKRGSILFDENPQTKRNNDILTFWKMTRTNLPKFVTGAWRDDTGDDNPVGALYNMAFVRLPIIAAFIGYVKNYTDGHPLYVDFGNGPFEFAPIAGIALLLLMLGPWFTNEKQSTES